MTSPASPSVSVVIPAYNAAGFIAQALDSVFAQSYGSYEVVVVNDGSPDTPQLEAALDPYRSRVRYLEQENRGPGGARNTGIGEARGEYVAFLDSDDAWEPGFLQAQMKLFRDDPGLDLVYADALLIGESALAGRTFMDTNPSRGEVTFASLLRRECVVITSCVVARRQALIDAGLFDERFFHSEDFDLWLRVLHGGGRAAYQRKVLGIHRAHGNSLTAESGALLRGQVRICEKLLEQLPLAPDERELLRAHHVWCQAHLDLEGGKRHLLTGKHPEAVAALTQASRVLGGAKLRFSVIAVRVAPGLLGWLYRRRYAATERSLTQEAS